MHQIDWALVLEIAFGYALGCGICAVVRLISSKM